MNWTLLRESLLNILLRSRKIIYKGFIPDCLLDIQGIYDLSEESDTPLVLALPKLEKSTCTVLKKLVFMIMELDLSQSMADLQGFTTRVDGVRTPVVDIILEELIYNNNILSSLLQALSLSLPLYAYITLTNMVFPFKHSELEMKTQIISVDLDGSLFSFSYDSGQPLEQVEVEYVPAKTELDGNLDEEFRKDFEKFSFTVSAGSKENDKKDETAPDAASKEEADSLFAKPGDPQYAPPVQEAETHAEVNVKIKAFCPPNVVEKNPCFEYVKYVIFPWFNEFKVERN
ncbi:unnamed protein product [Fraxinus pennsylvanica]|uniref:Uncharacterized protein n=1 Tax=Fraxinus pennsylvanica TaxID=56036 RepID=A0AAD2ADU1_9LAMI|nr:unnamed protein product [Fraxinus pennsylvanica]